jgi:tetratricopeptide (TPR) repeat protein
MRKPRFLLILGSCLALSACAPSYYQQAQDRARAGDHAGATPLYYREIQAQPDSHAAWRELGVSYYEQGDYPRAAEALNQAAKIKPDARTQLYLGMVAEKEGEIDLALRAYGNALGLEPGGQTRDLLEARVQDLTQVRVLNEVRAALNAESQLDPQSIPENTVAVIEFDGDDLPPELAPLAKGLAEFTALDLSKVQSLQVVDRLKIDTIRKELELSQSEFADPETAPRIGHLVGGRRIVTGTLLGLGDEGLRLDGAVVNTTDRSVTTAPAVEGSLAQIFQLQKTFVFDVIDAMGITLTAAERDEIEKVPTENYLAFLAYCRGLEFRDQNNLGAAQAEFQKAANADQGFTQAATQSRTVASLLSAGFGGPVDIGQFSAAASAASASEIEAEDLATFQATVAAWNGFVPAVVDPNALDQWAESPPHTVIQTNAAIVVRGNLNVQP